MIRPLTLDFGHGPDADDAFVFEPLIRDRVDAEGLAFRHRHLPFADLNRQAEGPRPFHVTMLSVASLARLTERWLALPFGGSFVKTMGPRVVAREALGLEELDGRRVAIPGSGTTAALLLSLAVPGARTFVAPYDRIGELVAEGEADAGLMIHEQQIAWSDHDLVLIEDLGVRWMRRHGLPTPLAACAIRSDLPPRVRRQVMRVLSRSLAAARAGPELALRYACDYTGGMGDEVARLLVEEYVSTDTYDLTGEGREAIRTLVCQAQEGSDAPPLRFADEV